MKKCIVMFVFFLLMLVFAVSIDDSNEIAPSDTMIVDDSNALKTLRN